jgi:hypothetical protein
MGRPDRTLAAIDRDVMAVHRRLPEFDYVPGTRYMHGMTA